MADRVHPTTGYPLPDTEAKARKQEEKKLIDHFQDTLPSSPGRSVSHIYPPGKASALLGTHVVQLSEDQNLQHPPPRNNIPSYGRWARRDHRRGCRCSWCLCLLITLLILLISAGVFYLVYRPKAPTFSVNSLSIQGLNLTSSSSSTHSPRMNVTVRTHNLNTAFGFYYAKGSSIQVSHPDIGPLCTGILPVFYQPAKNVTVYQTSLMGPNDILLTTQNYQTLTDQQKKRNVPLELDMKVPVKIKLVSIKIWTITFKVSCRITIDGLTKDASIINKDCKVNFKPWT